MSAYDELLAFQRETEALSQISGRLGWDQETMMARGSAPQRAEEMSAMASILHARRTDPRIGDWLEAAEAPDETASAQLRLIRRSFERTNKVPAKLAAEIARVTSTAQGVWAEARASEDWDAFAPTLADVVRLKREEAAALAGDSGDLYDALLDDYEPGVKAADLEAMFGALRPRLVALREKVLGAQSTVPALIGTYPEDDQLALAEELARTFGYDMDKGRIDKAVHPFSSGSGLDVRITTRTALRDPFNCIYSTIHEVGHAAYEQGINPDYLLTPLGGGVSMGVHESQSRSYENQIGRSRAFTEYLYTRMRAIFGFIGSFDAEGFYKLVNQVQPGFIRTEADEVHYNLHVLLRFDLERALVSSDLPVDDLPGAWNDRFLADFGIAVDKPSNGCLQDVHWSVGLFGYFPTYTLGNVYAGCLTEALRKAVPDLDADLRTGDVSKATTWMRENLQCHGGRYGAQEVVERAIGAVPSEEPLLAYLEAKFSDLYGITLP